MPALTNDHFQIAADPVSGAITRLAHPADARGMNWVMHGPETPWLLAGLEWGLGFVILAEGIPQVRWQRATAIEAADGQLTVTYAVGPLTLRVVRQLVGDRLEESYTFANDTAAPVACYGIGLCLPFNDNYPDADTCVDRRCNAHLWCGDGTGYAACLRMGGDPPHLGLVLTGGRLLGYSIEGRGEGTGSNIRGVIQGNFAGATLPPGGTLALGLTLLWHAGHDDFFRQARTFPAFLDVRAAAYTVVQDQPLRLTIDGPCEAMTINGTPVTAGARITVPTPELGEYRCEVKYAGERQTFLRAFAVPDPRALARTRVRFIIERQQVRERAHPLDGAFVVYDNEAEQQYRGFSPGAERLAMAVLAAMVQADGPDPAIARALRRYVRFLRAQLQPDGYAVWSDVGNPSQRLYNYPWVARFYLELARACDRPAYLRRCAGTLEEYYARGGAGFYALDIPVLDSLAALRAAGMTAVADRLLGHFRAHADRIRALGRHLPPHEVHYEQTIVAPAVQLLLEVALATGETAYADAARDLLPCLDAFNGRQPDYHLHEIAIRHWDAYWGGKSRAWGDTFPHYWSAFTGIAYYRYWQFTGDDAYRRAARHALLNNLCVFAPDGHASTAYLYPDQINGAVGRFFDPWANDQDWALVFLLQAARLDPEFAADGWQTSPEGALA